MNDKIAIRYYFEDDELEWLDVHASVMVDSYAWWTVIHKKPKYNNDTIDLVATYGNNIIGFITIEINADIIRERENVGFVWEFGVHRDYRGNNIGWRLIEEAHKKMRTKYGINKSIWYSQDESSQKYYKKIGMKEITRHWQFSVYPTQEQKEFYRQKGFNLWSMRGSCSIDEFPEVKKRFNVVEDDDPVNPRICIGFELIL